MDNKHTISDLHQMQSLPLNAKIQMTERRIAEWVDEYGVDGVYVSFSGGKDSTVLLSIARRLYPGIKAVFVDTGLEYPEVRRFVKQFDNVDWIRPKKTFKEVIEKHGYPFISKEVSECVYGARKFLRAGGGDESFYRKLHGYGEYEKSKSGKITSIENSEDWASIPVRVKILYGAMTKGNIPGGDRSAFNCERYKFFIDCPWEISAECCKIMKKAPVHTYARKTKRKPITAQMASESRLRTQQWIKNGCNGFSMKSPISNPMSFWTEQDVLLYIYENKLPIASVYGEIVVDFHGMGQVDGQMSLGDLYEFEKQRPLLKTTGCERTGCMFCGYGCHLEKSPNRFERMKETHPKQYDYIMKPVRDGGLGYKEIIDWINENGNMNIKY